MFFSEGRKVITGKEGSPCGVFSSKGRSLRCGNTPLVSLYPQKLTTDVVRCHLGMCDKHCWFFFFFLIFCFNSNSVKVCA